MSVFHVGLTRDFLKPDGTIGFGDIGLSLLESRPGIEWSFLADDVRELTRDVADRYDALLVLGPRVSAKTLDGVERLALVARFGVGYDSVDVAACTRNGVLLTITPDGVRRPLATAVLTLMLALSHKLLLKDRLTRAGRWHDKLSHMGQGLTGRTLGVIGLGNVGREVFRLAAPFDMRQLAADPFARPEDVRGTGIELVELDALFEQADFVVVCCALTPETHHLVNGPRLARMRKNAFLINVARGPVVDQTALTNALEEGRIQGAGLDVFEQEPIAPDDRLLALENVILSPHAICWTDECFLGNGRSACQSIIDVACGRVPAHVVNRDAIAGDRFQEKLRGYGTG